MNILELFDNDERFKKLARRRDNFREMVAHVVEWVEEHGSALIIETGSAWDKNNWEGQGQSTLIWDWLAANLKGVKVISIDITPTSVENAKEQTKHVEFFLGDSIQTLNSFDEKRLGAVALLYLDSFDWAKEINHESSYHHAMELAAVWRLLPDNCMICVDDRHGDFDGKHWKVELFMQQLGYTPEFRNHQVGWVK